MTHRFPALFDGASRSLEANIVVTNEGPLLAAGGRQFRSFWTRDFCFATPGLLRLGHHRVVRNHLAQLMRWARTEDSLIPRSLDDRATTARVLWNVLGRTLPDPWGPLRPEYTGEHGTPAIDSNILVLLAALDYAEKSGDRDFWIGRGGEWQRVLSFYESRLGARGLLRQGAFEDWQDSARREGESFYLNLLLWRFLRRTEERALGLRFPMDSEKLRSAITTCFCSNRLEPFRALSTGTQQGLDAALLALHWNFFGSAMSPIIWQELVRSPLWHGPLGPGFATTPVYRADQISWTTRWVGLRGYHDTAYWTWLMALSARVAVQYGETGKCHDILTRLESSYLRSGTIDEILDPTDGRPFRSWIYRSERPFSWGAGMLVDTLLADGSPSDDHHQQRGSFL